MFDGDTFIGFDSDALDPNEPLDALAHHTMRNQSAFNIQRGHRVCHSLYSSRPSEGVDGERAYAGVDWFSPFVRTITCEPRLERLEIFTLANIGTLDDDTATTNSPEMSVRLELEALAAVESTWLETTDFEARSITLDVAAPVATRSQRRIALMLRSNLTDELLSLPGGIDPADNPYPLGTYPGPDLLSYGEQATLVRGQAFDHMWQLGVDSMVLAGEDLIVGDWARWALSWIQMRAIWVETTHAPQLWPSTQLRGGVVEESEAMVSHVGRTLARHRGARLHHLGPRGAEGSSTLHTSYGLPDVWEWTDHDNAFSFEPVEAVVRLDEGTPTVTARLTVLCTHAVPDDYSATIAVLTERSATAEWDMSIVVSQLEDGTQDPVAFSDHTATVKLTHYPTTQAPGWSLLHGAWLRYSLEATNDAPWFKEGQIPRANVGLLQDIEVSVVVDDAALDVDRPVFVRVLIAGAGGTIFRANSSEPVDDSARLQLAVVGAVVEETHP